jgi:hypothetical protein
MMTVKFRSGPARPSVVAKKTSSNLARCAEEAVACHFRLRFTNDASFGFGEQDEALIKQKVVENAIGEQRDISKSRRRSSSRTWSSRSLSRTQMFYQLARELRDQGCERR